MKDELQKLIEKYKEEIEWLEIRCKNIIFNTLWTSYKAELETLTRTIKDLQEIVDKEESKEVYQKIGTCLYTTKK